MIPVRDSSGSEQVTLWVTAHPHELPGARSKPVAYVPESRLQEAERQLAEAREVLEATKRRATWEREGRQEAERQLAEAREALRPFLASGFRWKMAGQVSPWITKEQWEAALAALRSGETAG